MSTSNFKWSLYNPKTEVQIDGLKLSQAQSIVANLNIRDLKEWKAWHEGLQEWQVLSKFAELIEANVAVESPKPIRTKAVQENGFMVKSNSSGNTKLSFELSDEEFSKTSLQILEGSQKESRMNSRFTRTYEVKIHVNAIAYSCLTLDVSLGGMRIDRSLPASANNATLVCDLIWNKKQIRLSCKVIPDPKSKGSSRLIIKNLKDIDELRSFLLEGS